MEAVAKSRKRRNGCLIPLGLYIAVLVVGYLSTRPPLVTENFVGHVAKSFSVATIIEKDGTYEYGHRRLQSILDWNPQRPMPGFLLPEPRITIYVGDIHHASILEDHGDWQLVEYSYSNTYVSTSIYRAYKDRIEPVSYQLNSSIGDAIMATLVTMIAVVLYLLVALINFIRKRVAQKKSAPG